jgi:transposase-like protein
VGELYRIEISPDLMSTVTDDVLEEDAAWQSRAGLSSCGAIASAGGFEKRREARASRNRSALDRDADGYVGRRVCCGILVST